jgi:hypothetical protein
MHPTPTPEKLNRLRLELDWWERELNTPDEENKGRGFEEFNAGIYHAIEEFKTILDRLGL